MDVQVDGRLFRSRIKHLWHRWQTDAKLLNKKAIVVYINDPSDDSFSYGIALQRWLFNYEFRSTIFVMTDQEFFCLTSHKKVNFLNPLIQVSVDDNQSPKVVLLTRNRNDETLNYTKLINAINNSRSDRNQIGIFFKDKPVGSLVEDFDSQIATNYTKEGIDAIIAEIMLNKDKSEIDCINQSAKILSFFYKQTKDLIYQWIQKMKKGKDSELSETISKMTSNDKFKQLPKSDYFEFCNAPKIISGGKNMSLDYESESLKKTTDYNSIVCYFQGKIDFYCCTLARTILINPTQSKENNYKFSVEFHEYITNLVYQNKTLGSIYNDAMSYIELKRPDLVPYLTPCFGTSSGIDNNDKLNRIVAQSSVVLPQSFVLQIWVIFTNLMAEDEPNEKKRFYSIFLADTVAFENKSLNYITKNSKQLEYISISYDDPNNEENDDSDNPEIFKDFLSNTNIDINSRRTLRKPAFFKDKSILLSHQKSLKHELYSRADSKLRLLDPTSSESKPLETPVSYKSYDEIPKNNQTKNNQIYCDKKSLSVIFPIYSQLYPVHITKIKNLNVSTSPDERYLTLRINFNCPLSLYKSSEDQKLFHLKELHFRANNFRDTQIDSIPSTLLHQAANDIKEMQKISKKVGNRKEEPQITSNFKLHPFENLPRLVLHNVIIRPHMASKTPGNLEAFKNGFMYTKQNGDRFILPYSFIHISVYQPCDDTSLIIALHFNLSEFVLVGTKKTEYVQFYCEAGELSSDLEHPSSKRHKNSNYDDDMDEEYTIENKKRLRATFIKFCQELEIRTNNLVNFERPIPNQIFTANPNRSSSDISISENCLLSVIDWPPFILNFDDIELVYFERDIEGLTTCDMAIIFKDYQRKVTFLRSILKEHLHMVQTALDQHNIPFFSGIQALNWQKIMQTILDDPIGFADSDNWKFLSLDSSDEEEVVSSSESSSFDEGTDSSDEESSDEDDQEEESEDESDSETSGDQYSDDSDE